MSCLICIHSPMCEWHKQIDELIKKVKPVSYTEKPKHYEFLASQCQHYKEVK